MSDGIERWLPVPDYEGLYDISDLGRVWSVLRPCNRQRATAGDIFLKPYTGSGYPVVALSKDGVVKMWPVHRLVLLAFVGPCPEGLEALHGPAGTLVATLVNLSYGTHRENIQDKYRDGTMPLGEDHHNAKLTAEKVLEIRRRSAAGEFRRVIAADFGVSSSTIKACVLRQNWAWLD